MHLIEFIAGYTLLGFYQPRDGRNAIFLSVGWLTLGLDVAKILNMKITLKVKLITTPEQAQTLLETMEQFNEACNWISRKSFEAEVFRQVELHHLGG